MNSIENYLRFFANQDGNLTFTSVRDRLYKCGKNEKFCKQAASVLFQQFEEIREYIDPNSPRRNSKYNWQIKVTWVINCLHPAAKLIWNENGQFNLEQFKIVVDDLDVNRKLQFDTIQSLMEIIKQLDEPLVTEGNPQSISGSRLQKTITTTCTADDFQGPVTHEEITKRLNEIFVNLAHPNKWNPAATKLMTDFNRRFYNEGEFIKRANESCDPDLIYRLMQLFRYIGIKEIPNIVEEIALKGGDQDAAERTIDEFLTEACQFLGSIGRNEAARKEIVECNGLEFLIDLFRQNCSKRRRFVTNCFALGQILRSVEMEENSFKEYIINDNFNLIEHLFIMLQNNIDDFKFVEYIFFVISNISSRCNFEQEFLKKETNPEKNWVDYAITCLETYQEHVLILINIVTFLNNVAFRKDGKKELYEQQAILKVLNIIERHRNDPNLFDISLNLFCNMSSHDKGIVLIENEKTLLFLMSFIKQHKNNFALIERHIKTLSNIYSDSKDHTRAFLIINDYINTMIYAFDTFKENPEQLHLIEFIIDSVSQKPLPSWSRYVSDSDEIPQDSNVEKVVADNNTAVNNQNHTNKNISYVCSLKELASRAAMNLNLIEPKIISTKDRKILELDIGLLETLGTANKCDCCAKHFFTHYYEVISGALFTPLQKKIPLYSRVCSKECMEKLKEITLTVWNKL